AAGCRGPRCRPRRAPCASAGCRSPRPGRRLRAPWQARRGPAARLRPSARREVARRAPCRPSTSPQARNVSLRADGDRGGSPRRRGRGPQPLRRGPALLRARQAGRVAGARPPAGRTPGGADPPPIAEYSGSPKKLARRRDMWRSVITQQLQADELAVQMSAQLFTLAPDPEARLYYTTMVQDEARHTEAWLKLID